MGSVWRNVDGVITDVVTDFQGAGDAAGDTLELVFFSSPTRFTFGGNLAAMPLRGSSIGTSGDNLAAIFYAFSGGDTFVLADTNDNGTYDAEDFTVRLTGQHNLVQSDFGSTPIAIAGTNGSDTINGTEGNDTILALGGNDIVNGNGGNDRIEGGDGNDIVNGGNGDDNLIGGRGADQLNGNAGNDRIDGGDGNDILNGGDGIDRITGGAGNDIIDGGAGRDTVLAGGDGNDIVRGGDGNDTLDGDAGNDQLFGGNDRDVLFGLDGNDIMNGDAGSDELFGGEGNDIMNGGAGADELEGEEGADRITGGSDDDQFNFNAGAFQPDSTFALRDVVLDFQGAGLAGGDVIRLTSGEFAWVGQIDANPSVGATLPGSGDGLTQLGYIQHSGNTFLVADTNDDGLVDADDFTVEFRGLLNFTPDDFDNTDFIIAGTNGDDVITGTADDDRIFAAGGNDQVFALGGNDEVHGGTGDDFLDGGPGGFDNLLGEAGNDTLTLATSDIGGNASGGEGNDTLFGSDTSFSNFDNSLQGDAGNDDLHAGAVGSSMNGGGGSDRLFSSAADDQMEGGRDEFGFDLDNAQDLFVYTRTGRWSEEADSPFGDIISGFQDGSDLFDMRGSGLEFNDLTIVNEDFQTTITSDRGMITIFESFGQEVFIDQNDFLFGPAPPSTTSDTLII
jgi:Ca2+-binding RTX toxin-like protein